MTKPSIKKTRRLCAMNGWWIKQALKPKAPKPALAKSNPHQAGPSTSEPV
jgi:hypothetical protein